MTSTRFNTYETHTHPANGSANVTDSRQADQTGCSGDAMGTSWAMGRGDGQRDRDSNPRHSASGGHSRDYPPVSSQSSSQNPGGIETQRILTVFGSNTRRGYWEPPERLEVLSLFGGVTLDFTDANLYSGISFVNCLAIFGGIDIIVPADLEVDANGTGLFGGFDLQALKKRKRGIFSRRREPTPDLDYEADDEPPLLRVRGFALFGGVSVKVR